MTPVVYFLLAIWMYLLGACTVSAKALGDCRVLRQIISLTVGTLILIGILLYKNGVN